MFPSDDPLLPTEPEKIQASAQQVAGIAESEIADGTNPYALTQTRIPVPYSPARMNLSGNFWLLLVGLGLACLVLSFAIPGIGVVLLLAILPAAIRVPLVQRRVTSRSANVPIPEAATLLAASWGLMIAFIIASSIAFFVTCIPMGFLVNALNLTEAKFTFSMLFGCCGLFALAVFVGLFVLSLRMHG